jgi:NADH-quinone oxidoreductase subunit H
MPEAESEIIAGFLTEYSGFKYALFFMGEYLGLFAATGLGVTLFLGGWQAPVKALEFIPSWGWFFGKQIVLVIFFIWVRATLPRLRLDQLLALSWKFLVPLALVNIGVAAMWHLAGQWNSSAVVWGLRWGTGAAVIVATFYSLARILNGGKVAPRKYRYAK